MPGGAVARGARERGLLCLHASCTIPKRASALRSQRVHVARPGGFRSRGEPRALESLSRETLGSWLTFSTRGRSDWGTPPVLPQWETPPAVALSPDPVAHAETSGLRESYGITASRTRFIRVWRGMCVRVLRSYPLVGACGERRVS